MQDPGSQANLGEALEVIKANDEYIRRSTVPEASEQDPEHLREDTRRTINRIKRRSSWVNEEPREDSQGPQEAQERGDPPASDVDVTLGSALLSPRGQQARTPSGPSRTPSRPLPGLARPLSRGTVSDVAPLQPPNRTLSGSSSRSQSHREPRPDVVQFTAPIFFCMEDEGRVAVDMMRLGSSKGRCKVLVDTQDGSAKSGSKYRSVTQEIVFEEGDLTKTIEVTIMADDLFDTTLEFEMSLTAVDNCIMGASLRMTRVLIIDKDTFPANAFTDIVNMHDEDKLAEITTSLLWSFMVLVFKRVPTIWWKTILTMFIDQLHNIYYLIKVYIRMYLVDVVLNMDNVEAPDEFLVENNRNLTAVMLAILYAGPYLILLVTDMLKETHLEMGKAIRTHFKVNLFRKYLNYTEEAKHKVPVQDLATAMDSDIPELVDGGYMFGFDLLQGAGKIMVVGYFLVRSDLKAIVPLMLFPVAMVLFLRSRQAAHVELENRCISAEEDATGMLVNSVETFSLIRDYSQRSAMSVRYESMLKTCFMAMNRLAIYKYWNDRFVPALTLCMVSSYLVFGSQLVLIGEVSLGTFLATIDIYLELGTRFQTLYKDLESGIQAGSPLVQLTKMLNLPTDVMDRKRRNRERRTYMKEHMDAHEEAKQADPDKVPDVFDRIPIKFQDIHVDYVPCLRVGVDLTAPTEKLIFATGTHGTGKATLLRVLADIKIPSRGTMLFSSHMRCIHVDSSPLMLQHLNLLENLQFGAPKPVDNDRVARIFYRLGLHRSAELRRLLHRDLGLVAGQSARESSGSMMPISARDSSGYPDAEDDQLLGKQSEPNTDNMLTSEWHTHLSISEAKKLHLARALVFSPQLLIVHKPSDQADAGDEQDMLLALLRDFVDHRGIENPTKDLKSRRPRTCFFSGGDHHAKSDKNAQIADIVWRFADSGIYVEEGGWAMMRSHNIHVDVNHPRHIGSEPPWYGDSSNGHASPATQEPEPQPAPSPPAPPPRMPPLEVGPPPRMPPLEAGNWPASSTGKLRPNAKPPTESWAAVASKAAIDLTQSQQTRNLSRGLSSSDRQFAGDTTIRALSLDRGAVESAQMAGAETLGGGPTSLLAPANGEKAQTTRRQLNANIKQGQWCRRCA